MRLLGISLQDQVAIIKYNEYNTHNIGGLHNVPGLSSQRDLV